MLQGNQQFFFCQVKSPLIMRVQPQNGLCKEALLEEAPWWYMEVGLFSKAIEPVPIKGKAHVCAIKKEKVIYSTDLWDNHFANASHEINAVNEALCRTYISSKECHKGKLTLQRESFYTTNEKLEFEYLT